MLMKCVTIFKGLRNSSIHSPLIKSGLNSFPISTKKHSDPLKRDQVMNGNRDVDQQSNLSQSDILNAQKESFGRLKGFVGEHKYYFLQIAMVLLMVNIATRTIINSKDIVVDHRQYLSTT
jgi:hypothetical protein